MITPIPKPHKETKAEKLARRKAKHLLTAIGQKELCDKEQKKADRAYQEWGRKTYKTCFCGGTYSCLHHFILKSHSLYLRYNKMNGVPVCVKCHCNIHLREDFILILQMEDYMTKVWGEGWRNFIKDNRYKIQDRNLDFYKKELETLCQK